MGAPRGAARVAGRLDHRGPGPNRPAETLAARHHRVVIALLTLANQFAAGRLVGEIVSVSKLFAANAAGLLATGGVIWATNVTDFGLWYWDLDRGGAAARAHNPYANPAFVFAEMQHTDYTAG